MNDGVLLNTRLTCSFVVFAYKRCHRNETGTVRTRSSPSNNGHLRHLVSPVVPSNASNGAHYRLRRDHRGPHTHSAPSQGLAPFYFIFSRVVRGACSQASSCANPALHSYFTRCAFLLLPLAAQKSERLSAQGGTDDAACRFQSKRACQA